MTEKVMDRAKILLDALSQDKTAALRPDIFEMLVESCVDGTQDWLRCKEVLKQYKVYRDVEPRVRQAARQIMGVPSIGLAPKPENSIVDTWRSVPHPDGIEFYAPPDYIVSDQAPAIQRIERRVTSDGTPADRMHEVSLDPILVTKRIGHLTTKNIWLEVQFRTDSGWHKQRFERDVLLNSRKIVDTARAGIPVSSGNALELTEWFRRYENQNREAIPLGFATSSMGWQGSDEDPTHDGFMVGERQIGGNGRAIEIEGSPGDIAEAKEIRERGTLEGWKEAIERMLHFPSVRLVLYASLAAPLILPLEGPNAVIEWAGRTSTGKSTILKIAQSCWKSSAIELPTWDNTLVGLEASVQFKSDLPTIVDDTSTFVEGGRNQSIGKVIYKLVSGRTRGRGTIGARQATRGSWRTVVLASGEAPISDLVRAEGAAARVLTFWAAALGPKSDETKSIVRQTLHDLSIHYGQAGPRIVRWMCDNRDKWPALRKLYDHTARQASTRINSPAASRLADIVALLECTASVAHHAGVLEARGPILDDPQIMEIFRKAMTLATANSDRAYEAWEHIMSDAHSRPKSWINWGEAPGADDRDPLGGWLGYRHADFLAWFPPRLKKALADGGFQPESIFRAWKDLGVLQNCERDRFTSQCRPGPPADRSKQRLNLVGMAYPGHEDEDD